jgi:hypothetical protein
MNNLKDKILGEIKAGRVAMTPRTYFTLKLTAFVATAIAVIVVSIFIFNFIFFSIRINEHDALLGFGPQGLYAFLRFFPWHLLAIDIGLIILLQWVVRHFRFAYKIPVLYLLAALILAAFALGFALDRGTPFNDRLHEGREHLPRPVRGFYEGARRPPSKGSGVCRCTIIAIEGSTLIVEDTRSATATMTILLPSDDRHATTSGLEIGDVVFIAGQEEGGIIRAFGVRREAEYPRPR